MEQSIEQHEWQQTSQPMLLKITKQPAYLLLLAALPGPATAKSGGK
jgi:hypothetical protein